MSASGRRVAGARSTEDRNTSSAVASCDLSWIYLGVPERWESFD
jgi:hypothetical protein